MNSPDLLPICPRCECFYAPSSGAVSKATQEDGGAPVNVCRECGLRELVRSVVGADLPSFSEWPLSISDLLWEDRVRIEWTRMPGSRYVETADDPRGSAR